MTVVESYRGALSYTTGSNTDFANTQVWLNSGYSGDSFNSGGGRYGWFTVVGSGTVTITADFTLTLDMSNTGDYDSLYALVTGQLWVGTAAIPGGLPITDVEEEQLYIGGLSMPGDDDINQVNMGSISIIYEYSDGDFGWFSSNTNGGVTAVSPVPVPSTMILLGSGLVGLARFKRKKKK